MSAEWVHTLLERSGGVLEIPCWVGGQPHVDGGRFEDFAPATGESLASVVEASEQVVDAAVAAARQAQPGWNDVGLKARAERVTHLAEALLDREEQLGRLEAFDTGSPIRAMRADVRKGADYLRQCAMVAIEAKGDTIPASDSGWHLTIPQPWGVVGAITAYNHPILFACQKAGPALMMGNTLVMKPAEQAPLTSAAFGALASGLLPHGVVNVVFGGAATGEALVKHPDVPRLTFTGSVQSGLAVQQSAAASDRVKSLTLELGGKNPIIVAPDCDPDIAADAVVRGMNFTRVQGQSCGSTSRLLVHEDLQAEVVERIVARVREIRMGLPEEEMTEMGCLISQEHLATVIGFVHEAQAAGARLLYGGEPPHGRPELERGAFLLPTVFDRVEPLMRLARDEIFGPVLAVLTWKDDEEAIRLANDTDFGLTASIWTKDIDRALYMAKAVEAGYVWVNDVERRYPGVPFGGWKQSGVGTEQGLAQELLTFSRTKSVNIGSTVVGG